MNNKVEKVEKFEEYAIVEMMGHRKIAGKITDSEIGGSQLLRVDVLNASGDVNRTEYIGVGSIYCLTVVSREVAEAVAHLLGIFRFKNNFRNMKTRLKEKRSKNDRNDRVEG